MANRVNNKVPYSIENPAENLITRVSTFSENLPECEYLELDSKKSIKINMNMNKVLGAKELKK